MSDLQNYDSFTGITLPTFLAVLSGTTVVKVNVLSQGANLTSTVLYVSGGGGKGCVLLGVLVNGRMVDVTVLTAGVGYTSPPLIQSGQISVIVTTTPPPVLAPMILDATQFTGFGHGVKLRSLDSRIKSAGLVDTDLITAALAPPYDWGPVKALAVDGILSMEGDGFDSSYFPDRQNLTLATIAAVVTPVDISEIKPTELGGGYGTNVAKRANMAALLTSAGAPNLIVGITGTPVGQELHLPPASWFTIIGFNMDEAYSFERSFHDPQLPTGLSACGLLFGALMPEFYRSQGNFNLADIQWYFSMANRWAPGKPVHVWLDVTDKDYGGSDLGADMQMIYTQALACGITVNVVLWIGFPIIDYSVWSTGMAAAALRAAGWTI
jgi:hypothetical protein